MILSKYRNWHNHSSNYQESEPKQANCKNCGTLFKGNYCPQCGQGVKELDRPFGFIFINFMGDLFAFDSRFLRTIKVLLFKPGFLTKQFFDGKRMRYATPTRLFILTSFLLFFLLQIYSNRILTSVLDAPVQSENVMILDSLSAARSDSLLLNFHSSHDTSGLQLSGMELLQKAFAGKQNIRDGLHELSNEMEKTLWDEADPAKRVKLREQISLIRTPEQAIAKILRYMSWAFFLLLPVFALILNLFYIRQKHFFIRHLVFSIHLHAFIFFIFILLVLLHLLFDSVNVFISLGLIVVLPVYFILALKLVYGQNILKVFLKFTGIAITYNILFWVVVGSVFLRALSII